MTDIVSNNRKFAFIYDFDVLTNKKFGSFNSLPVIWGAIKGLSCIYLTASSCNQLPCVKWGIISL